LPSPRRATQTCDRASARRGSTGSSPCGSDRSSDDGEELVEVTLDLLEDDGARRRHLAPRRRPRQGRRGLLLPHGDGDSFEPAAAAAPTAGKAERGRCGVARRIRPPPSAAHLARLPRRGPAPPEGGDRGRGEGEEREAEGSGTPARRRTRPGQRQRTEEDATTGSFALSVGKGDVSGPNPLAVRDAKDEMPFVFRSPRLETVLYSMQMQA